MWVTAPDMRAQCGNDATLRLAKLIRWRSRSSRAPPGLALDIHFPASPFTLHAAISEENPTAFKPASSTAGASAGASAGAAAAASASAASTAFEKRAALSLSAAAAEAALGEEVAPHA